HKSRRMFDPIQGQHPIPRKIKRFQVVASLLLNLRGTSNTVRRVRHNRVHRLRGESPHDLKAVALIERPVRHRTTSREKAAHQAAGLIHKTSVRLSRLLCRSGRADMVASNSTRSHPRYHSSYSGEA